MRNITIFDNWRPRTHRLTTNQLLVLAVATVLIYTLALGEELQLTNFGYEDIATQIHTGPLGPYGIDGLFLASSEKQNLETISPRAAVDQGMLDAR